MLRILLRFWWRVTSSLKISSGHKLYKASWFFFYITVQYDHQDWYIIDVTNDMVLSNPNGLSNWYRKSWNKLCHPQINTVLFESNQANASIWVTHNFNVFKRQNANFPKVYRWSPSYEIYMFSNNAVMWIEYKLYSV